MGRELKRVALDFNWPLHRVWKGFINPHAGPPDCPECDAQGVNAATRELVRHPRRAGRVSHRTQR